MKKFLSLSNASSMSLGFFAISTRRALPILPFLAPVLCKQWPTTQSAVVGVRSVHIAAAKAPNHDQPTLPTVAPLKSLSMLNPILRGQKSEGNDTSDTPDQEKERMKISEELVVDEVAEEDEEDEQVRRSISGLFEDYAEKKLRNTLFLLLKEGKSSKSMAKAWSTQETQRRRHGFRYVAGYLLKKQNPSFCTRLIECCCLYDTCPPAPEDVAIVLEYLTHLEFRKYAKIHRKKAASGDRREGKAARLIDLALALLRVDYGGPLPLRQSTIFRLVRAGRLEDVLRLYDGLREAGIALTTNTTLHFIDRLSDPRTWVKAYTIMEELSSDRGQNIYLSQVWKTFHTLFYNATFIGEEECSAVIRMMLDCGLSPGISSYNILMTKASRNQDEESVMQIFRQMTEAGLKPTMATYGLLYNHYKRRGAEEERSQVMRDALRLDKNLNVTIATDIVHAKALTSAHYMPVLDEYLNFFDPEMLVALGIAMPEYTSSSRPQTRLQPDHITIAIMVHSFCVHEGDPMAVWAAYNRYKTALRTGEPRLRIALTDAGSYIPNAYMLALGCHEQTLWHCAAAMEDILKPDFPVQANVYSWSILLYAMAKARKLQQAEQVLGAMRRKGIEPNVVTWTSLLTGYVRINRLRKAGEVMRRMTAANVEPNYATMGLLATIIDSHEFTDGMMEKTPGQGERIEDPLRANEGCEKIL